MIGPKSALLLTVPPAAVSQARAFDLPLGYIAYRVGPGAHLLRLGDAPQPMRSGMMVLDAAGCDGRGDASGFCREALRECAARGFTGILCDFDGPPTPLLTAILTELDGELARRGWPLYVPEQYGRTAKHGLVFIPSALSRGTLRQRLEEAGRRFGPERVALAVQRVAEDFFLPASPRGRGAPLSRAELQRRMDTMHPSVFFSDKLCAHYFTYMSRRSGAHFVLFDTAVSIREKLKTARSCGVKRFVLAWPEVDDILPEILA